MRANRPPGRDAQDGPHPPGTGRPTTTPPPSRRTVIHRVTAGRDESPDLASALLAAMPDPAAVDEHWRLICRQMVADMRLAAYRAGYHAGRIAVIEDLKALQQEIVRDLDLHLTRWDGLRADFGKPRPGDYTGGPVEWSGSERR